VANVGGGEKGVRSERWARVLGSGKEWIPLSLCELEIDNGTRAAAGKARSCPFLLQSSDGFLNSAPLAT